MRGSSNIRVRRPYRVLSVETAQSCTAEQLRWLRALGWMPPMAGADGEGEGEGAGGEGSGEGGAGSGESGGGEGEGGSSSEGDGSGEGEGNGDGNGDGDGDGEGEGHPNDRLELSRSEYERLRRIAREHDQDKKRRDREEKRRKEEKARAEGQYEELLHEKDEQISTVEAERDEARYQLDAFKRRIRVQGVATRLNYKDPDDAHRFLSDEDTEDDTSTERALKSLAKKKPYLVHERRSTGAPVNGVGGGTLTKADLERMSPEEINAKWDEVQKAMAGGL